MLLTELYTFEDKYRPGNDDSGNIICFAPGKELFKTWIQSNFYVDIRITDEQQASEPELSWQLTSAKNFFAILKTMSIGCNTGKHFSKAISKTNP